MVTPFFVHPFPKQKKQLLKIETWKHERPVKTPKEKKSDKMVSQQLGPKVSKIQKLEIQTNMVLIPVTF